MSRNAVVLTLVSVFGGCAARDFGQLDPAVIAFADQVDAERGLELALDDDHHVIAVAGAIDAGTLPGLARDVALALQPEAVVEGGSLIVERDGAERETWEVDLRRADNLTRVRVRFDDDGVPHVVQTRRAASDREVPAAVRDRAAREFGAGTVESIEIVEQDATVVFHVTKSVNGTTVRMAVARDGTITEVLRVVKCGIDVAG